MGVGIRDLQWLSGFHQEVNHLARIVAERVVLRRALGRVMRRGDNVVVRHRVDGGGALVLGELSEAHFILRMVFERF